MIKTILTTLPVLVCVLMTIQLMLEQRRRKSSVLGWLIAWSLAATLLYIGHFAYFNHIDPWMPLTTIIYIGMNISVYPLYLLYISELTDIRPLSTRPLAVAGLLGPAAVAMMLCSIIFMLMGAQETAAFLRTFLYDASFSGLEGPALVLAIVLTICRFIFVFQVIAVGIMGTQKVRKYHHTLSLYYADTEDKEAYGLTSLLYLVVATSFLSAIFNFIGRQLFLDSDWLALPSLAFSVLLFAIGWIGMNQRFSIHDIPLNTLDTEDADAATQEGTQQQTADWKLYIRFDELVCTERLYLKHDLRLESVTKKLGTNRTYLLNALNNCRHITFKEYINKLRIEYAEQLMEEHPEISKIDVAIKAGYNNPSSFYRNYKQYHKRDDEEKKTGLDVWRFD